MTISHQRPERILNRLVRAGPIVPLRGPGGWFVLALPADKIAVGEIVAAAGGRLFEIPCLGPGCAVSCGLTSACRARPVWPGLRRLTDSFPEETNLAMTCPGRGGEWIAPHRRVRS